MLYLSVKDDLIRELNKHFDSKIHVDKRISVISDLQMFRPKEDKFVWAEKKGHVPEHVMVYWDGVHILTFNESEDKRLVMYKFWQGFTAAYKQKTIKLTPPWLVEEVKTPTITEKQLDKLNKIKPTTKAERMAKDIVKNIITKQPAKKHAHT